MGARDRGLTASAEPGARKAIFPKEAGKISGAGICDRNRGELIHEAAFALKRGTSANDISQTIHGHPTLATTFAFVCKTVEGSITDGIPSKKR